MKKVLIGLGIIVSTSMYSQFVDGTYNTAKIVVSGGNIISIEDGTESDPTVDVAVKGISNTDQDHWNMGFIASQWGNPNGVFVSLAEDYNNPQWFHNLALSKIAWEGTSTQYMRANGTYTTFPSIPNNTNQLTNGSGFLTIEIDGSVTNEIELPTQSGQSGKYLTTNGSTTNWNNIPSIITQTLVGTNGISITSGVNTYTISKTKRQETYTATTNSVGIVSFTFSAFSSVPSIMYTTGYGTTNKETCIPSVAYSTTGCSFKVELRSDILGVLPTYSNVVGREVSIIVTEN